MNIFDFIALTNDEQLETVHEQGVYLSTRKNAAHRITLYGIEDFYVEVYFHLDQQQITMLSAIHGDRVQDLYSDITPFETHDPEHRRAYNHFLSGREFPEYFQSSLS